jgi:hypothetical protein
MKTLRWKKRDDNWVCESLKDCYLRILDGKYYQIFYEDMIDGHMMYEVGSYKEMILSLKQLGCL